MKKKIKLIWDFYGSDSYKTAVHHQVHLIDYLNSIEYPLKISEVITIDEYHSFVYIVVKEEDIIKFRDILKPRRAELYED